MKNNNSLNEKAILSNNKKQIAIMHTLKIRDYALFNTKTGEQETPFVNGGEGSVVFSNLNPNIKYEIKVKQNENDGKYPIHYIWALPLYDDKK